MNQPPVILITGASRGLGRGIAQQCARTGFSVAIHFAGNEAAANETVALCQSQAKDAAQKFIPVRGNLNDAAQRKSFFEQTLATFGRLDALVNNAGMAPRQRTDLTEMGEESYDEVMGVNLKGPFFLSQMAARHWLAHPDQSLLAGGYKLIFITSVSADTASVNRGEYCLSKAGLAMAAQLLRRRQLVAGARVADLGCGLGLSGLAAAAAGEPWP